MSEGFEVIEDHLFNYHHYQLGYNNMKRKLDNMTPRMTATYDEIGGGSTGVFTFKSQTEDIVVKRLDEYEQLRHEVEEYRLVIESIDEALKRLNKTERMYVELRYLQGMKPEKVALKMKYSTRNIYALRKKVKKRLSISLKNLSHITL